MKRKYKPMLAKEASTPFSGEDWIFEVKWDGFRAIAYVNEEVSLRSRNDKELIGNFPELTELKLKNFARNVVLDGEIIILKEGKVDFQALLERGQVISSSEVEFQTRKSPAAYVVFDILEKDGKSLVDLPLMERKKILKATVKEGAHILLEDFVENQGEAYYKAALQKGLEGIIAKRKDSVYTSGVRSGSWLKLKKLRTCDCVIFGYTRGTGARAKSFGALLLGLYDKSGKPVYVGKVGTGFSEDTLNMLLKKFAMLETGLAPFVADIAQSVTWLKPTLVCTVTYQVVTKDRRLRMPRFQGIRTDKQPLECTLDQIVQDSLEKYAEKRDFAVTPEPKGVQKEGAGKIFVVQEHHSRRLHFDFRLERDGVLKSWAVPKGIPDAPEQKRLAVETEDHPLDYAGFEGVIPKGQYGAGVVKIWDKGSYEAKVWDENMVEFTLSGENLRGRYVLVRLKKAGEKSWLMLKARN